MKAMFFGVSLASSVLLAGCDGVVNNFDIDPFVLAITNEAAYRDAFPNCTPWNGDLDRSSAINNFDIEPFVNCLANLPLPGQPCPPPEM